MSAMIYEKDDNYNIMEGGDKIDAVETKTKGCLSVTPYLDAEA